ncbi:hypothetical protein KFL_003120130 [Klebsormidium nitens]|uniref:Uncharacterized protein n=1 Tax=Klebsormidium nitens TaxID=105231 RepID=A0A1Y1IDN0_KLENI|nr:hypothetical protein KFL_003120130 [Klebsormidium nitens]|eukprot:GAQ86806.1 hypothetical protein KFL_003120130 [Klebsormidium nitens]
MASDLRFHWESGSSSPEGLGKGIEGRSCWCPEQEEACFGYVPTSLFPWSYGSSFRKRTCLTPPGNPEASPHCGIPAGPQSFASKRASVETSVGEPNLGSPVRKRGGLGWKRPRVILLQELEEQQQLPPRPSLEEEKSPQSGLGCDQEKGWEDDRQAQVQRP